MPRSIYLLRTALDRPEALLFDINLSFFSAVRREALISASTIQRAVRETSMSLEPQMSLSTTYDSIPYTKVSALSSCS